MAIINWDSDTDVEYIYDYGENIAMDRSEIVTISIVHNQRLLTVIKSGVLITTAVIDEPKKPRDTGGDETELFIPFVKEDKVDEFRKMFTKVMLSR